MNLQKITTNDNKTFWLASQAEASAKRADLVREGYKRVELTTEAVDVPTDKQGLISFLNGMSS
jgi:hypothetical protein